MAAAQQQTAADELDLTGYTNPGDLDGFDYIRAGTYHIAFTSLDPNPLNKKKEYVNAKRIGFQILAGTDASQIGKQSEEDFNLPDPSHKDGGDFCRRRLARLALKTGLVTLADMGKRVAINWADIVARQAFVVIEEREYTKKDGSKGKDSQIQGLGIFAINDPEMAGVPRDQESLEFMAGLLPEPAAAAANGAASETAAAPQATATPAAAADPFGGM